MSDTLIKKWIKRIKNWVKGEAPPQYLTGKGKQ